MNIKQITKLILISTIVYGCNKDKTEDNTPEKNNIEQTEAENNTSEENTNTEDNSGENNNNENNTSEENTNIEEIDYLPNVSCLSENPSEHKTTNITATGATLSWKTIEDFDHSNVRYRAVGSSEWISIASIQPPRHSVTIPENMLMPQTTYEWQVTVKCEDSTASSYSANTEEFTTLQQDENYINPSENLSNIAPSDIFDFSKWKLDLPEDLYGTGKPTTISPSDLGSGYQNAKYFYTNNQDNKSVVFKNNPTSGVTTPNSSYARCELREMMDTSVSTRGINANNWVFGLATQEAKANAGAIDGKLEATLTVDRVSTTGSNKTNLGSIVIGQIHASDDEPCRLYYQKQPEHNKGAIYFVHHREMNGKRIEYWYNLVGDYITEGKYVTDGEHSWLYTGSSEPSDGIALGEKFSYTIEVIYDTLYVTISREGKADIVKSVDMSESGYESDWFYFKAGVYSQNNLMTMENDYEQATFHELKVTH